MKLIIAGSRTLSPSTKLLTTFFNELEVERYLGSEVEEIVSGTASGVDKAGEKFAADWGMDVKRFPADWDTHGKAAGHIRNKQMAEYADALLLVWDGESRGSANMKQQMLKLNKPVYEVIIRKHDSVCK